MVCVLNKFHEKNIIFKELLKGPIMVPSSRIAWTLLKGIWQIMG